jgi:hypothetical protein
LASTTLLYNDLLRQGLSGVTFQANVKVPVTGSGTGTVPILAVISTGQRVAIALSGPLTNDHPTIAALPQIVEQSNDLRLIVVNELLVRGNLPAATRDVRQRLGK